MTTTKADDVRRIGLGIIADTLPTRSALGCPRLSELLCGIHWISRDPTAAVAGVVRLHDRNSHEFRYQDENVLVSDARQIMS